MEATRLLPDIDMPLRSLAGLLWTPRCEPGSHERKTRTLNWHRARICWSAECGWKGGDRGRL